jgi:hypothetical protein
MAAKKVEEAKLDKISDEHLALRNDLIVKQNQVKQQHAQLAQALKETEEESIRIEGGWRVWRQIIESAYNLTNDDRISDDGIIQRANA